MLDKSKNEPPSKTTSAPTQKEAAEKTQSDQKIKEAINSGQEPPATGEKPQKSPAHSMEKPEEANGVKKQEPSSTDSPQKQESKDPQKKDAEARVPVGDCTVCDKKAKLLCSACKFAFYCTRECQKSGWKSHKEDCKALSKLPYRVRV